MCAGGFPATVPGSVLEDLRRTGEVPDPYHGRNSLLAEWVPARTWLYRKTFAVDGSLRGRRIRLAFDGVDHDCRVYLNGELLGRHVGMFTPFGWDVGERLRYGEPNLLAVVIERAPDEESEVGDTSRVRTHKSRMTYGWDFCPRMVHQGIWQGVGLEATGQLRIEDVWLRPRLGGDRSSAVLEAEIRLSGPPSPGSEVELLVDLDGRAVGSARGRLPVGVGPDAESSITLSVPVEGPSLWWPNGHGGQPLYRAAVAVTAAGQPSDERHVTFGFRDVRLVANPTPDETARGYTLEVNGRWIHAAGWNWTPMDVLYGVLRHDRLEHLLRLAEDANVTLLRVWGGGLIETEAFYDWCDRLAILVWQEFIQSSSGIASKPPEDPGFVALMRAEAERIVPLRRNHASLAIWGGGNELTGPGTRPLDDAEPVLAALHEVVERLDPGRPWPTSPTGREFANTLESIARDPDGLHDVHGPWEHQGLAEQPALWDAGTALLNSEFGTEGITNLRAIEATIDPADRWPATRDNATWSHRGAWWNNTPFVQAAFGGRTADLPTLVRASQWLQADGLRYAVEANRRRWPRNSGSLPWQFGESYPNATCTSAVDYFGEPKAAYHAVARAYRTVHVSAAFPTFAWGGRERFTARCWVSSSLGARGRHAARHPARRAGEVLAHSAAARRVGPARPVEVLMLDVVLGEVTGDVAILDLALDAADGTRISGDRYVFSITEHLAPLVAIPATSLAVEDGPDGRFLTLRNVGEAVALGVRVSDPRPHPRTGFIRLSDGHLVLFPGEQRTLAVTWQAVPPRERSLAVESWNAPVRTWDAPDLVVIA